MAGSGGGSRERIAVDVRWRDRVGTYIYFLVFSCEADVVECRALLGARIERLGWRHRHLGATTEAVRTGVPVTAVRRCRSTGRTRTKTVDVNTLAAGLIARANASASAALLLVGDGEETAATAATPTGGVHVGRTAPGRQAFC